MTLTSTDERRRGADRRTSKTITLAGTSRSTRRSRGAEIVLMIYHRNGIAVAPLSEKPTVVGRSAPSHVIVPEASVSRRHAQFTLDGDTIRVEDLGSRNGTLVHGCRVEAAELRPGAKLQLGGVQCVTYVRAANEGSHEGILGHDPFVSVLERCITDARYFGDELSVVMLRALDDADEPAHVSRWLASLRDALRPVDVVGLYGQDCVEVVMPRLDAEQVRAKTSELVQLRGDGINRVLAGVASFPGDGATAGELLELSRSALTKATPKVPMRLARDVREASGSASTSEDGGFELRSEAMRQAMRSLDRVAVAKMPVLLVGETGVGKELVARSVHAKSNRKDGPFVAINCGAIPRHLVEATLFGHEKGAFTGADQQRAGVFEAADGGTVLLDEIGELPAEAQAALLRTLETGEVMRVGATRPLLVDARVIAATHRDLVAMSRAGTFREDLLHRINALSLKIPPLRDREEAIAPLAQHFVDGAAAAAGRNGVRRVGEDALAVLQTYRWPGNIRELRNVIERACVIAEGDEIRPEDLPPHMLGTRSVPPPPSSKNKAASDAPPASNDPQIALRARVRRYELGLIERALRETDGDKTAAAKTLKIPLRTLNYKLKTLSEGE